ncbi:MAG: hypothetical protein KBT46_00105 [Ruminococcus sp.]|nr:hypothetical protein [Candidatus Copronaster equi]
MTDNFKNTAAWDKFASSGKICDYLQYKHLSTQEKNNEADDGRTDNTGTADGRG